MVDDLFVIELLINVSEINILICSCGQITNTELKEDHLYNSRLMKTIHGLVSKVEASLSCMEVIHDQH